MGPAPHQIESTKKRRRRAARAVALETQTHQTRPIIYPTPPLMPFDAGRYCFG